MFTFISTLNIYFKFFSYCTIVTLNYSLLLINHLSFVRTCQISVECKQEQNGSSLPRARDQNCNYFAAGPCDVWSRSCNNYNCSSTSQSLTVASFVSLFDIFFQSIYYCRRIRVSDEVLATPCVFTTAELQLGICRV